MGKKMILALVVGGMMALLATGPLYAARGDVTVGGDLLFRVRVPSGGLTIQERVDRINERLVKVLGDPQVKPGDIKVHRASPDLGLFIRNQMIVTLDENNARANGTTRKALGQDWMRRMKRLAPQY
ncbi:MAG: hypothetical protein IT210_09085 [Armatimonadetes bacterium]|nr:hypothetical protein [Armatimonadota bacterium]